VLEWPPRPAAARDGAAAAVVRAAALATAPSAPLDRAANSRARRARRKNAMNIKPCVIVADRHCADRALLWLLRNRTAVEVASMIDVLWL
jgi:hypothetical protein